MSRTFSTKAGSLDSLKVSLRCGCKPKARQIRPTVKTAGLLSTGFASRVAIGDSAAANRQRAPVRAHAMARSADHPAIMHFTERVDSPTSLSHCERDDPEITAEMIEAGEGVVLGETGGADLGSLFSAADLTRRVYLAIERRRLASLRDECVG
jgi:hypothetical protein